LNPSIKQKQQQANKQTNKQTPRLLDVKSQTVQSACVSQKESLLNEEGYQERLIEIKVYNERMAAGDGKFSQRHTCRGSVDTDRVNISEELSKTTMWSQLQQSNKPAAES
jgi:hypothetical protein